MSASSHARRERTELAELLLQVGPDAPTLCEGWTTRDLAAHLVIRESRPDAAVGIVFAPLSGWTDRVQRAAASQSYAELVRMVRTGPPTLSVFSLPGVDSMGNLVEFVIHHEDVRRAQPGWAPRELPDGLADEIWQRLGQLARLLYRRVPVGVTLLRTDGPGGTQIARPGTAMVTITGPAQELLLRSYGRTAVRVQVTGDDAAITQFEAAPLTL
jgi:uncharacterized protein (TIGR03085 family)